MVQTKTAAKTPKLAREIKKALIDADIGVDQIGGSGAGSTWAWRIRNPGRMTIEDFLYLCNRLHISAQILDDPKIRKETAAK